MADEGETSAKTSRRDALKLAASAAAVAVSAKAAPGHVQAAKPSERHRSKRPSGLSFPGHELAGNYAVVQLIAEGDKPDIKKRGSRRTMYDGRYKVSRYFSALDRNSPKTIDDLDQWNDGERFDLPLHRPIVTGPRLFA